MELLALKGNMGKDGGAKLITQERKDEHDAVLLEIKEDEEIR